MLRFRISTLMIVVAVAALAAWIWILFTGMDDGPRILILAVAGVLAVFPLVVLALASIASLFGRWTSPGEPKS